MPKISIGAMRLPGDPDDAVALLRHAIDNGMCYIDTSRGYGESEWIVGRALKEGYRDKVRLSTKWSPWNMPNMDKRSSALADCVRRRIEESMRRLGVDCLDYYQVWSISCREHYEQAVAKGGLVEGMLKAKDEGLVRHLGFTTHDQVENIQGYIREADWCETVLMSYNLLNNRYAPAIRTAREKGIMTAIMNPVGGGRLAEPSPVLDDVAGKAGSVSIPDMAVRYVLSNPDIDTILIGIAKPSDVDDSLASVTRSAFSADTIEKIEGALDVIKKQTGALCTRCGYCMPCPEGIDIVGIMSCVLEMRCWGWERSARARYGKIEGKKADACTRCGECEKACTQQLDIIGSMAYARENLSEDADPNGGKP